MNRPRNLQQRWAESMARHFGSPQDGRPGCAEDWTPTFGINSEALLHAAVFMPELVLLGDSVLLWHLGPDAEWERGLLDGVANGENSRRETESSFNWIEVGYHFGSPTTDTTDEEDELLAWLIRDAWDGG